MSFYPGYTATNQNQFDRLGHPGKYTTSYRYTSGQVDFTGSNFGYGAILINTVGGATASLSNGGQIPLVDKCANGICLSNGGQIPLAHLSTNTIHELSISQIKGGTNSIIYVLKRQTGF